MAGENELGHEGIRQAKHAFFKVDVAPVKLGWVDDVTASPSTEAKSSYIEGKS